jgi:hypothetical protein
VVLPAATENTIVSLFHRHSGHCPECAVSCTNGTTVGCCIVLLHKVTSSGQLARFSKGNRINWLDP